MDNLTVNLLLKNGFTYSSFSDEKDSPWDSPPFGSYTKNKTNEWYIAFTCYNVCDEAEDEPIVEWSVTLANVKKHLRVEMHQYMPYVDEDAFLRKTKAAIEFCEIDFKFEE